MAGQKSFPLRAKPDYYRRALYKVLTTSPNLSSAFRRVQRVLEKISEAQAQFLRRGLTEPEVRELSLTSYKDIRTALLALAVKLTSEGHESDTGLRRTQNIAYLRWRIEKEILMLHWGITMRQLEERQLQSGMRMSRFLQEQLESEGLG